MGHYQVTGRWRLGLALSLITTVLWGSIPVALKSVVAKLDPVTATWYRYAVAAAILTLWLGLRGGLPTFAELRQHGRLAAIAVTGFVGNNVTYLAGLQKISAFAAQILVQLAPPMVILGAVLIFHERLSKLQIAGVAGLAIGIGLFFHRGLGELFHLGGGHFWIIVAALTWTAYALAQKRLTGRLHSFKILWIIYSTGFLLLSPAASPRQAFALLTPWEWVFLLHACINGLVAYVAFAEAMVHWEASRVGAVSACAPLLAPTFTALFAWLSATPSTAPPLSVLQWIGAITVVSGCAATALAGQRRS